MARQAERCDSTGRLLSAKLSSRSAHGPDQFQRDSTTPTVQNRIDGERPSTGRLGVLHRLSYICYECKSAMSLKLCQTIVHLFTTSLLLSLHHMLSFFNNFLFHLLLNIFRFDLRIGIHLAKLLAFMNNLTAVASRSLKN